MLDEISKTVSDHVRTDIRSGQDDAGDDDLDDEDVNVDVGNVDHEE